MMKIKVGEYVRTLEDGYIGKLVEVNKGVHNYYKTDVGREIKRDFGNSDNYIYSRDGLGLKHSPNIIDLVEKGDYVNGHLVLKVEEDKFLLIDDKGYTHLAPINFKSIVTKEQFENISYKVEG